MTSSRLTPEQVREIRELGRLRKALQRQLSLVTLEAVGRKYGRHKQRIHDIQEYVTYAGVSDER